MPYRLTIPARINILGNPSDANEGDFATISTAIEMRAGAFIQDAQHLILEILDNDPCRSASTTRIIARGEYKQNDFPLQYDGPLDLMKGAVNRLYRYSPELRQRLLEKGVQISIWSDVPRQSGLGGSSLFVLLTLAGLRVFYNLDYFLHNDYILSELTQRVEAKELGITAGFADRYVPLFGGLAYLDYRGKLWHQPINHEPYVTYERLHTSVVLPMVAISTGIKHDSGDVHGRMRPRYLEEYTNWQKNRGEMPPMVQFMTSAWETAWQGKIALLSNNLASFGELMKTNHRIVNEMMLYCGFDDGAGWANNLFIDIALKNGALGAKLTGAGGGGSVFALVRPGEERKLINIWQHEASRANLTEAWIYRPRVARRGLIVKHFPQE